MASGVLGLSGAAAPVDTAARRVTVDDPATNDAEYSWPIGAGPSTGSMPRQGHRSEPHTQVAGSRMMASVSFWSFGSSRSSTRISRGPYRTAPRMEGWFLSRLSAANDGTGSRPAASVGSSCLGSASAEMVVCAKGLPSSMPDRHRRTPVCFLPGPYVHGSNRWCRRRSGCTSYRCCLSYG
jgi:hypothetical protein